MELGGTNRCAAICRVVATAILLAGVGTGCGSPASVPTPGVSLASSPAAVSAVTEADVEAASPTTRTEERLDLPYREYSFGGLFQVDDVTDQTAVLRKSSEQDQEIWLMDLTSGDCRRALAAATSGAGKWWLSGAKVSDAWMVWEELEHGDDLVGDVSWRLFAAPVRRSTLTVGEPRLIASSSNQSAARPLFDLNGSQLVWISNATAGSTAGRRSLVMSRDLAQGDARVLHRAGGILVTVGFSGVHVIATETPSEGSSAARTQSIIQLSSESGEVTARVAVPSPHGLSHWPAWRHGWLAWAPFPAAESAYPEMYLRSVSGRVYGGGDLAVDPCIVGTYLFYQSDRPVPQGAPAIVEVRALRLSDLKSMVLTSAEVENDIWWHAPMASPSLEKRYVVYGDNMLAVEHPERLQTMIRVYEVR